jgi:hypothetical protein
MTYDKKLLEKWFETRAEVFVQRASKGFVRQTIDAEEVRKEFRIIAQELSVMLDSQNRVAIEQA